MWRFAAALPFTKRPAPLELERRFPRVERAALRVRFRLLGELPDRDRERLDGPPRLTATACALVAIMPMGIRP